MVFVPHRGELPVRLGPGIPLIPDIGPSEIDRTVYTDADRYQLERRKVLAPSWQIVARSSEIPDAGDYLVWEGQGETIVVSRRRDGGLAAFHNVCQHRGARIVRDCGNARRFTCRWHSWVYDLEGHVIGVPDREDFAEEQLEGLRAPAVEADEWGGWIWVVLAGPGVAPPLLDWIGPEIVGDLGAYRMQDMRLVEKLTWDVPVNWKICVDGFNEAYHAAHLHTISSQDVEDGRHGTFFTIDKHGMMVMPYKNTLQKVIETGDHQAHAICHYTLFPTAVFNNNPEHIQLFRPVPLAVNRTRFEVWELQYPDEGDTGYRERTDAHWQRLKGVVTEDVEIWDEWAAASNSSAYTRNLLNDHEAKIKHFHDVVQAMLDA